MTKDDKMLLKDDLYWQYECVTLKKRRVRKGTQTHTHFEILAQSEVEKSFQGENFVR